jgi:hypothetical protein
VLPNVEHSRVDQIFDELGPIPRLCIDYVMTSDSMDRYKSDLDDAISKLTIEQLQRLCNEAFSLTMGEVSHKLFLIKRKKLEDLDSQVVVAPITGDIKKKLACQFRNLQKEEQIRLYKHFEKVPDSRAVAGIFFEAACQRRLQEGMNLELVPMVKLDPPDRKEKKSDSEQGGDAPVALEPHAHT